MRAERSRKWETSTALPGVLPPVPAAAAELDGLETHSAKQPGDACTRHGSTARSKRLHPLPKARAHHRTERHAGTTKNGRETRGTNERGTRRTWAKRTKNVPGGPPRTNSAASALLSHPWNQLQQDRTFGVAPAAIALAPSSICAPQPHQTVRT